MERSRLKYIIIIILALLNVSLLISLTARRFAQQDARALAEEQLVALFAADGITLDPDILSYQTPPSVKDLIRSDEQDRNAAAFFLGEQLQYSDQGGSIHTYTGRTGAAMFRATGSFDIVGSLSGVGEDAQALCRRFCQEFSCTEPEFDLNETGSGTALAYCVFDDLTVFNSPITFTLQQNRLTMVSGTLLPRSAQDSSNKTEPLSASAALTAFLQFRQESGAVVSAIEDLYLCCELQSSPTSAMTLYPSWCISTNTVKYYVNCTSGSVTAG